MQLYNFSFTVSILQCFVSITISDQEKGINEEDKKLATMSNDKDFAFAEMPKINSRTSFNVNTGNSKYISEPYEHPVTAQSGIELGE